MDSPERRGMITDDSWKLAGKADALRLRARMMDAVRRFFREEDFLEVETPLRIPAPAPESHIEAVASGQWFLQTSPELCMKRLLAAGYPRIFQISKCFRQGERGERHLPEFTLLEWYRAQADYRTLMEDCQALLALVARELGFPGVLPRQGGWIDLSPPWERITVREAFGRYATLSADEALGTDRFDELLTGEVEPHLGILRPVFLCDYPVELAALARAKEGDPGTAERFELYLDGIEMANGFSELIDVQEQRRRFVEALGERSRQGSAPYPMPEKFLAALAGMPPSAGIALGLDRLAMLLAGKSRIDDAVAFTPESL